MGFEYDQDVFDNGPDFPLNLVNRTAMKAPLGWVATSSEVWNSPPPYFDLLAPGGRLTQQLPITLMPPDWA
jgi:hypothetical protein